MRLSYLVLLLTAVTFVQAQVTPAPPLPPPARIVRLHFALPPLDGTISLGIFDLSGRLVRVLHREDEISEFTAGHDALETTWDGNDDAGNPLPSGRYHARGYLVANVQVEGVDDFFNDWVSDEDSPHLEHISGIEMRDNLLALTATSAAGKLACFVFDPRTNKLTLSDRAPAQSGPIQFAGAFIDPIDTALGKDGTIWGISHLGQGSPEVEVVQISANPQGQFTALRKLSIAPSDPQPIGIAASPNEDRIFLLEQSPALERVRSLTLQARAAAAQGGEAVSDWKVDFEKKIVAHRNFALVGNTPVAAPNEYSKAPETTEQKLRPNPLDRDRPGKVALAVGFDADGSFLKTADGLPLRTISDNGNIKRALIAPHSEQAVDIFQDDGAVVEQFRISQLDQMMAFDCGEFELK